MRAVDIDEKYRPSSIWNYYARSLEALDAYQAAVLSNQLVKYRHWLAHGRYWTQKSGIRPTPEQAWDTGTIVFAVLPGLEDALM